MLTHRSYFLASDSKLILFLPKSSNAHIMFNLHSFYLVVCRVFFFFFFFLNFIVLQLPMVKKKSTYI